MSQSSLGKRPPRWVFFRFASRVIDELRDSGTLVQINRALVPDGLFLAAMMGGETLFELR